MIKVGFGQTSGMAIGTLASRITGVLRDVALVAAIGTAVFSDGYSVANSIPNIIYILIAGGAINSVFIPALVRRMQDDEDNGQIFANRLLTFIGILLIGIVALTMIFAPLIIRLYATTAWSSSELHTATIFAYWCLPQIFFYGVYTLVSQVLNARNIFALPMFAPIVNNLIVITTALGFIVISDGVPDARSVNSTELNLLGAGTLLGIAVQALLLIPALRRSGFNYQPRFDFRGSGLMKMGDLAVWTFGFVMINQISFLIISNLTTYANVLANDSGTTAIGFTSYQKGQLMMMLPHAIITVSLITSLLPRLSKNAHIRDDQAFGEQLTSTVRLVAAFIIPCAGLLAITGPTVGILLYGHGAATMAEGASVGFIASVFALGLPAFSLFYTLLRSYYAREDTRTPFLINLGFNAIHISVALLFFYRVDSQYKVASIALAYSIAYTIVCTITWRRVSADVSALRANRNVQMVVRVVFATLVSCLATCAIHTFIFNSYTVANANGSIARILFDACAFALGFAMLAKLIRITEVNDAISQTWRRFAK